MFVTVHCEAVPRRCEGYARIPPQFGCFALRNEETGELVCRVTGTMEDVAALVKGSHGALGAILRRNGERVRRAYLPDSADLRAEFPEPVALDDLAVVDQIRRVL